MKVCKAQTKVIGMGKVQLDSRVPIEIELRYFDYQLEVRRMIVKRFIEQRKTLYFSFEMKICLVLR